MKWLKCESGKYIDLEKSYKICAFEHPTRGANSQSKYSAVAFFKESDFEVIKLFNTSEEAKQFIDYLLKFGHKMKVGGTFNFIDVNLYDINTKQLPTGQSDAISASDIVIGIKNGQVKTLKNRFSQ
jgi:hypothetical protein